MKIYKSSKHLLAILAGISVLVIANTASASYLFEFDKLSANAPVDYSDQYSVLLEETATGVSFTVNNAYTSPELSSITGVYFEYGDSNVTVNSFTESDGMGTDVEFYSPGSPDHLPGGNGYFDNPADYGAHTNGISGGIDSSTEYITFLATLGTDYQTLLDAISAGTFRIGLHVQGILPDQDDWSDAYVSTVPVPAAAWLFATALIGFVATSRRRKNHVV
ncbi:MAG: VPLPA-CTERM sorting domain-containing protein [Gammaproteobacteria bacterium]|jgi:hypothetical protein